jgi:putative DNA primase/helicase
MIDGMPGAGKTYLAMSVDYCAAAHQSLLGWQGERAAKALYVDGEMPGDLVQERIQLLGPELPGDKFRVLAYAQFANKGELMIDLGTEEGRDYLDEEIEQHGFELIILDSVCTLVRSGTDNDFESWRAVQEWSLKHRARGRTVIFLHHHGRSGKPRGTSGREIVLNTRIKMSRLAELSTETETAFKLEFEKGRSLVGVDMEPLIAFLSTEGGTVAWHSKTVPASNRERVKELRQLGWAPKDIAKELQLTPSWVSQIMTQEGLTPPPRKRGKTEKVVKLFDDDNEQAGPEDPEEV